MPTFLHKLFLRIILIPSLILATILACIACIIHIILWIFTGNITCIPDTAEKVYNWYDDKVLSQIFNS